jgi:radical SAM superfamily enzyme YgiQ (UPF0313 family)
MADTSRPGVFHFVMIKPSHYDDDGYVIQWARSDIPSNTLATLYGLALECAEQRVLGDSVAIRLTAYDETNTRIRVKKIIREIEKSGGTALVGLIGVQSNQFPRAVDIAREFRALGVQVCIGGFHVSGCLAMLSKLPADLQGALDLGISLFAGEAEGHLASLFEDAYRNEMKPIYNYMSNLPNLDGTPGPYLPADRVQRTRGKLTSFDAGRGCPFLCSFCTIINVQGRQSRTRSPDDIERIVRKNIAQGIHSFFITDDNFARNRDWENLLDRLIYLREVENLKIKFILQVDTMCHKVPGFIEKAARAGVTRVFIGLENINPESLGEARKGQNRITEYRAMLQAWHNVGVVTYAGYILGFPADTPETILRDIQIIQRELPIDILEFFFLTPLPGSADHKKLYEQGAALESDLNKYDLLHVTTSHPTMSRQAWENIYSLAWDAYFSPEHVETVVRRAKARGIRPRSMMKKMLFFYACYKFEKLHPLEGGYFRRKYRRDRRPSLPIENPLIFYGRYAWENIDKYTRFLWTVWRFHRLCRRVEKDPSTYTDLALRPVVADELEALEIFTATEAAKTTVQKVRKRQAGGKRIEGLV